MKTSPALLAVISIAVSVFLTLSVLEIVLRFFPVSTGMMTAPVTFEQPVAKFTPNRDFVWSDEWNFTIANRGHINNDGFVNDQDYDPVDKRPLMAIIGDSFVEAVMVPYEQTLQGLLAKKARVYSFAASGAPLSQYLIWAKYAKETYKPQSMTFVIIGNDFDESLPIYTLHQTFHQFVKNDKGALEPKLLQEFKPSWPRAVIRSSALVRYIYFNLNGWQAWSKIKQSLMRQDLDQSFAGNTSADTSNDRVKDSKQAVDAFFKHLPHYSGLKPRDIVFVVDANRGDIYIGSAEKERAAYFDEMRRYFMKQARAKGYHVVDMDSVFTQDYAQNKIRFDYPSDSHWNEVGHKLVADAVAKTAQFKRLISP